MKNISAIAFRNTSKEELLPGFTPDFPYIASYVALENYPGRAVPWHWHKALELFYIKSGVLEYYTPQGKSIFPAGSGGLINTNVLHRTKLHKAPESTVQLVHLFDESFLGGAKGSRIAQKYIYPITASPQMEFFALKPGEPSHAEALALLAKSFTLSENAFGYEVRLRSILSEIWVCLASLFSESFEKEGKVSRTNEKIKDMMIYIHENYERKITVAEVAAAAFISERECYRAFHDCLRTSPVEYMKSYRLQASCNLLETTQDSITDICHACGWGSSSYFGKVFRENMGCTPLEYRRKRQNSDTRRQ